MREPRIAGLLATVTPRPFGKVFLAHEQPWWRPLGLISGRATTDLPIRQIYYFGTEPDRPAGSTGYVTMGYFDRPQLDYWAGLRRLEQPAASGFTMLDPEGPMATEVRRQIGVVHGLDRPMATPLSVGFMNWEDDPYGGAWHTWNQGVKSWEVMKEIAAPVPGTALHIVGEAWSTNQGMGGGSAGDCGGRGGRYDARTRIADSSCLEFAQSGQALSAAVFDRFSKQALTAAARTMTRSSEMLPATRLWLYRQCRVQRRCGSIALRRPCYRGRHQWRRRGRLSH